MQASTPTTSRSALIVGEGGFAARSLERIEQVTEVVAVATRDPALAAMAEERGLPVLRGRAAIERFLAETPVDYLFSLDNPIVLSAAILDRVRILAANWHDSPLPAYGGLNATSWAIAAGETMHASVLHEIREGIDDGDIYVWRDVPIDVDDTAAALNAKCFAAGLDSMDELLGRIVDGTVEARPQRGAASYHGFDAVPPNAALLDPTASATAFERWSRALDFGPAVNRLASVRVLAQEGARTVLRLPRKVQLVETELEEGETQRTATAWLVACSDGTLSLSDFRGPDGERAPLPDAILTPDHEFIAACVERCAALSRYEDYWVQRLREPRLRWALPPNGTGAPVAADTNSATDSQAAADRIHLPLPPSRAPTIFAAYLMRTRRDEGATIGLRVPTEELFFASSVPLLLPAICARDLPAYRIAIDKTLARAHRRGTYALDATARWRLPPPPSWSLELAIDIEPSAGTDLALHITGERVFLSSPSGQYARELARIGAQLTQLADAEGPLLDASLFTADDLVRDTRGLIGAEISPDPRTVATRIAHIAEAQPDTIAIACGDREVSYGALLADVARIASQLEVKTESGSHVALHALAPYETVVASLAVIFARAAYVPLGGDETRARVVLEEARAALEITPEWLESALTGDAPELPDGPTLDESAYVIFTSGTTGRPKGVVVRHANLAAQLDARIAGYGTAPKRFLSLHSPSFDSFVAGLYWTLCTGGTLVLASEEERHDPFLVASLLRRHAVSHLDVPPALYAELLALEVLELGSLEVVIVGGEACPPRVVRRHHERAPHARLHNEYGPTEATVFATVYDVPPDTSVPVPIGRPIAGVSACVVDRELRPLPPGFIGELVIAGPTIVDGYFERPDQTRERFVVDPRGGGPAYRTGDLVRLNDEDQLEWLGRIDGQVQVRGYRVELSALEAALESLEGVSQAAAALVELGAAPRLCAFVVSAEATPIDTKALRTALGRLVPSYSLPDHIERVAQIPRTSAGKIDRRRLRPTEGAPTSETPPPCSAQAVLIAKLMGEVLGRAPLGGDDDFFDRGGNSFLAIRLVRRIEEASGVRVAIVDLFRSPTPNGLAARMARDTVQAPRYLDLIQERAGEQVVFVGSPAQARALARHLDRGITGLNVFGMPDTWIESGDLTEIAEEFARELAPHCRDRPIVLTGFCDDTKVAAEMLPRLLEAGVDVRGFVAIDGGWMLNGTLRTARRERLWRLFRTAVSRDRRQLARAARLRLRSFVESLRVRFGSRRYQTEAATHLARDQALAQAYQAAQARYARVFGDEAILLLSRTYKTDRPPANLDVRPVPVDHTTLFLEPQVQQLAAAFREALAEHFGHPSPR